MSAANESRAYIIGAVENGGLNLVYEGHPRESMSSRIRMVAALAIVFECWFVVALVALHLLRPDLAPSRTMISRFAIGPYGSLMTSAFVAAGLADLMLLVVLLRVGPRAIAARAAELFLGVAAVGLVISAIFPMDVPPAPTTNVGSIHEASFMVNVACSLVAPLLLAISSGSDIRWRPFRRTAWWLSVALFVAFGLQVATIIFRSNYGVANKLFVAAAVIWAVAVAFRARAITDRPGCFVQDRTANELFI